jgi:hypothetical protein
VHLGREDETGHRDGPQQVLGGAGRRLGHGGPRLGEEVLDDHLLDVAEAGMGGGDGLEGGQLSRPVVPDADQDPGREGDVERAGGVECGQAPGRLLVGGSSMRLEVLRQ